MTDERVLRGAIVGCGGVTKLSHLPAWRVQKNASIVAVCDQNERAARDMAGRARIRGIYSDFSEMLRQEELDFVDICTPPRAHARLSVEAMEAGLHVLIEKPMAVSLAEADEMVATAERHGAILCTTHNLLFTPPMLAAKSIVAAGGIGELVAVDSQCLFPRTGQLAERDYWGHRLPGGIFGEYAPHLVYMERAFLGSVSSIKAVAGKRSGVPWVTYDELKVVLEGDKGFGSLGLSFNGLGPSFLTTVLGAEGVIRIDNFAMTMTRSRHRGCRVYHFVPHHLGLGLQAFAGAASAAAGALSGRKWYRVGHEHIVRGFVASVRSGAPPPVTAEDGRDTVGLLDEIWGQIGWRDVPSGEEDAS
jgi:predicted dehydrogenase